MTENQELIPMLECSQPAVISQNLIDLGARVLAVTERVKNLPRGREHLGEVKKVRAEMRKYFDALETQRKQVKADVLEPYLRAEAVYKDYVAEPMKKADALCKGYVDEVESAIKKECEDGLRAYFTELCRMKGIFWLAFEKVGVKVDMATANQKEPRKAREQIRSFVEGVDQALQAIAGMEDASAILAEYESTLDLTKAIQNVNARKKALEISEQNRAKWREIQDAKAKNAALLAEAAPDVGKVLYEQQEKKYRVTFTITATMPMLRGLKAFLEGHNYEYQEVTNNG